MRGRGLMITAALTLSLAGTAQAARSFSDPAGDANGSANTGRSYSVDNVNDASRDLTRVTIDGQKEGVVLRFALSGAPDLAGPFSWAILRAQRDGCEVGLAVAWGKQASETGDPVAISDVNDCASGEGFGVAGYAAHVDESTVVAFFPWEALTDNRTGLRPGSVLKDLEAETGVGTFVTAGTFGFCSPEPCYDPPDFSHDEFEGPLVDSARDDDGKRKFCLVDDGSIRTPSRRSRRGKARPAACVDTPS